jgi:hypothetical protein
VLSEQNRAANASNSSALLWVDREFLRIPYVCPNFQNRKALFALVDFWTIRDKPPKPAIYPRNHP